MSTIVISSDQRPDGWGDGSAAYDAWFAPVSSRFAANALRLLGLEPGQRLLDVAAGTGALTLQAAAAGVNVVAVDRGASPMSSQTLPADAGRPEPGTERTPVPPTACSAGEPDCGGDSAEAAARQRIFQARAWQWRAGLSGDLCEHRSATAALQRACDELAQASTIASAARPASPSAPPSAPSGPALPSSRARPCGPPD